MAPSLCQWGRRLLCSVRSGVSRGDRPPANQFLLYRRSQRPAFRSRDTYSLYFIQTDFAMNTYTINQIEDAINYWREHQASGEDAALCPRARVLADVYGLMIYHRMETVLANALSPEQNESLNLAL